MTSLSRGAQVGPYLVLGPLGSGGMGEVWEARDRRLGRHVALKTLLKAPVLGHETDWYAREGRLLAQLNHPNIAQVYGLEEVGGVRALVLELVPGESLDRVLKRGPVPPERALSIARQLAAALEAAHGRGVIHRDLKPANLMLTPDGTVKVLDFGLAKSFVPLPGSGGDLSSAPTFDSSLSAEGALIGTLPYMSPEQVRGRAARPESDVWAAGCVLFEMLAGVRPFRGETPSDTVAAILERAPDWRLLPAATPDAVRALLGRCLEKEGGARFQSGRELHRALEELERPPSAGPPSGLVTMETPVVDPPIRPLFDPASPHVDRSEPYRRLRATRASLVAAALLVAGTWWVVRGRTPEEARLPGVKNLLVLPFRDASGDPAAERLGEGIAQTLAVRLAREPGVLVLAWPDPGSLAVVEASLAGAARRAGANLVVKGTVQRERVVRVSWTLASAPAGVVLGGDEASAPPGELLALEDRVAEQVAAALRLSPRGGRAVTAPDPALSTADAQDRYLQALGALSRYDRPRNVDEAISLLSSIPGRERSPLVQGALARAFVLKYAATKDPSWAEKAQGASAEAIRTGADSPSVLAAAGQAQLQAGRAVEAIASFRSALALQPDNAEALIGLAEALDRSGNDPDAARAWQDALTRRGGSWSVLSRAAGFDYVHGRYRQAADLWRRAAALVPDNVRVQSNLGGALFQLDDLDGARAAFDRALALEPTATAWTNLGTLLYARGEWAEAAKAFEMATGLGGTQSLLLVNQADACRRLPSLRARSEELYRGAIEAARRELQVDPDDREARLSLAIALAKLGDSAAARKEEERVLALAPEDPDVLFQCAVVSTVAGRKDEALVLLGRAVAAGKSRAGLRREPELSPLHGDSRFVTLAGPPGGGPFTANGPRQEGEPR